MNINTLRLMNATKKKQTLVANCHYVAPNKINVLVNENPAIPSIAYSGAQLISLYNIPIIKKTSDISRQVIIAIIIAYHHPNIISDLKMYWQSPINFGKNSTPPVVNIFSFGSTINIQWGLEECLDVQMVCTINPNAKIWVVEAKSNSIADLLNAINYAVNIINADVISMSWGSRDINSLINSSNFSNSNYTSANYKCFCASTGDNNYVSWPAVLSNCIAVGGTTLIWSPTQINHSNRIEYTWSVAGCGYSTSNVKPSYQNAVNTTMYRSIPDLSLIANPKTGIFVVYNGVWQTLGGTSVSCPIFASILSLANQQRFNNNKDPLTTVYTPIPTAANLPTNDKIPATNIQNYLYKTIYNDPTMYTACFNDTSIGSDGSYNAGVGFDVATGLGSPNATGLCNLLINL